MRLRSLQTVGWGHLASTPIGLGAVTIFAGANGSGKSSALDAIKAALGARRFGQRRSPQGYLHRGPDGAAERALVCVVASGLSPLGGGDLGTLVLEVTSRRRRFALVEDAVYLGVGDRPLDEDLAQLEADIGGRWRRPEQWSEQVMTPLGVSPRVVRLLELPQGEAHRALQARPHELVGQLVGLLGHEELDARLTHERAQLTAARERREEARAALLAERRRLLPLAHAAERARESQALGEEITATAQMLAGALAAEREALGGDDEAGLEAARAEVVAAREARARARADVEQVGTAVPADRLTRAARALCAQVPEAIIVAEHLHPAPEDAWIGQVLGRNAYACVVGDQAAFVRLRDAAVAARAPVPCAWCTPTDAPVAGVRAAARPSHPLADAWLARLGLDAAFRPHTVGAGNGQLWVPPDPAGPAALPIAGVMPTPAPDADALSRLEDASAACMRAEAALAARERDARTRAQQAQAIEAQLARLAATPSDPDGQTRAALEGRLAGLQHARTRLGDPAELARAAQAHALAEARCAEVEAILGEHDETVRRLGEALRVAQELWAREVHGLVESLDARFRVLCAASGMEGRLALNEGVAGAQTLEVEVAEYPGGPRRSLHRDGELSGGWRAKVSLLLLLAALSGDGRGGVVLLDEHAAQLDEARAGELGEVFARLAGEEGMQFILCQPTTRAGEEIAWCDQQVGFLSPAAGAAWAPAPMLIARDHRSANAGQRAGRSTQESSPI